MKISIKVFYKLVVSFLGVVVRHAWIFNIKYPKYQVCNYFCNISKKKRGTFCKQINIKLYYKLILLILVDIVRPTQITQNKYLKKWGIKLIFCGDQYHGYINQTCPFFESLLQVGTIILDGFGQEWPSYLVKFAISLWYFKKEIRDEVNVPGYWFFSFLNMESMSRLF